ncbi:MAG: hypothetical protein JRH20_24635, partial [Deltaproteobacteria bacterium]|nr:hypothetical protein [Deltaproteobacteria bacterium]
MIEQLLPCIVLFSVVSACSGGGTAVDVLNRDAGDTSPLVDLPLTPDLDLQPMEAGSPDADMMTPVETCIEATGLKGSGTVISDTRGEARVSVEGEPCEHTFTLSSTTKRRDDLPANPRIVQELPGAASISTGHALFDALYALALAEARENSVDAIQNDAFDDNMPLPCPSGGCFETGRLWTYVWTRDISYAADLALAGFDPTRTKNSLEFKTSNLRDKTSPQIVQDTGTGGSYPISSDRAVWALGAARLLNLLEGAEREAFRDGAAPVVFNTIEHDRQVVLDARDGLYRGEQSFLDWREQTYPSWVKDDLVHIGMSKALSTNLCHLRLLELGERLATEKSDTARATRYAGWALELRAAIAGRFTLDSRKLFSTFITTELDQAPVQHHDLLGTALGVLFDVFNETQARDAVANYPHLPFGVPVIWPQQQQVRIYHNRAIWPFVSAYWLKAARKVRNAKVVDHTVRSLVHAAALNLSNMENLEMVSGEPWVKDDPYSGPVVNSQRQLWSVAGYLSMVQDVIFGLEIGSAGIRAQPFITTALRNGIFAAADTLVLNRFPYRGHRLSVVVHLPLRENTPHEGAYRVRTVRLDGTEIGDRFISHDELSGDHRLDVVLEKRAEPASTMTLINDVSDYRNLFSPQPPRLGSVSLVDGKIQLSLDPGGEAASDITFNIYRDGVRIASALPGTTTSWRDAQSSASSKSHCYALESLFSGSKNASQHSMPACFWGAHGERVRVIGAASFVAMGGTPVTEHGKFHYQGWGDPGDTLVLADVTPTHSGPHLLQLVASNGAGSTGGGVTAGVKTVRVEEIGGSVVAEATVMMPHHGW